jgi:hypothetical protein
MPESESNEMTLLYAIILFACIVWLAFECWKGTQLGQWEPLRLTASALICVAAGVFWVVEMRKPKS